MVDRVWRLNGLLPNEWGKPYGLREVEGKREPYGIGELVDKRIAAHSDYLTELYNDFHLQHAIFDHARKYRRIEGSSQIVAVTTAPYFKVTRSEFNDDWGAINARIHEIAQRLGLYVRIGHRADVTYLSNNGNDPTLPITWWQPSRISLPLVAPVDPNPDFTNRMETTDPWS